MYLKRIEAQGFKSFADKITIDLENNITGIVGPNGSGKSNVVDAIRWVLGEQSIKSLRGDGNMTDVIFSGSSSRNASSLASVSLLLDNKDHYFKMDQEEILIKRRVYKDGTNEYFLNNDKVRLKDVTNILLDSGIAKESFNIISQGKIEEILSNKPEDRRIIFEEAAGVLKYKRRKEEALRKLDKTHTNMNRVNDIIEELSAQIEPLQQQKDEAIRYQTIQKELTDIEIALILNDITVLNDRYQADKKKMELLQDEIYQMDTQNRVGEAKVLQFRNHISALDQEIQENQTTLLEATQLLEQANSRKAIILERQKYQVSDAKLHDNLLSLKEKELKLNTELELNRQQCEILSKEVKAIQTKLDLENQTLLKQKEEYQKQDKQLAYFVRKNNELLFQIESLQASIDANSSFPVAVQKVLDNPKLTGIHDAVGNLLQIDEVYSQAISTALGISASSIIVQDENKAKEAILYLKNNHFGRATFFPLNIIKPKGVDPTTLYKVQNQPGFVGLACDLVQYDPQYRNIILNQLGNVLVVDTIDHANALARIIDYKYRIVTLDGEILHVGGSLTGGSISKSHNVILDKYQLENLIREQKRVLQSIQEMEESINRFSDTLKALEDKIYLIDKEKVEKMVLFDRFQKEIKTKEEEYKMIHLEISGTNHILENELSKEEEEALALYYQALDHKNKIESTLKSLQNQKQSLSLELSDYEISLKKENATYSLKTEEYRNLEIAVNRYDVKLDTLLNNLSETYSLSYEAAMTTYKLEIPENTARTKVNTLKRELKEIGVVNLGAISEYERIHTRYEFLQTQKEDLTKAENTLLEIIDEMDKVMKRDFLLTFELIRKNFVQTFKELFKGGSADLKLSNPDDILTTGVEIIASPPGKKLTTISLLSGGEKTFTAISLLFAILKSKPVPFCVLDEVEAALDDVNVDSFGAYIKNLKEKTQFIIITHKKKTMEYVDVLYGITMQESGVSKLVSVKLEEL